MDDATVSEAPVRTFPGRWWLTVFEGRSGERLITAVVLVFCILMFYRGLTVYQFNDTESAITIEEARSISQGYHRWGLLEYTHHPIGRAYLLIPLVKIGAEPLIVLPVALSVAATTLALLALLSQASGLAMRSYILFLFASLLWQPGFVGWLGNLHQHSYNMASILLIIAIGVSLPRVALAYCALGFVSGWIGYDVLIPQLFTAATIRMAFYGRDLRVSPGYAAIRAAGDAAAFGAAFMSSVLLHLMQNALYFSSASMAYWDFFGSLGARITFPIQERLAAAFQVSGFYLAAFIDPTARWTIPALLWLSLAAFLAASVYTIYRMIRTSAIKTVALRRWWLIPICSIGALTTVFGWFLVAPRHAGPHLHLFPRMLFVPILVLSAVLALVLSERSSNPPVGGFRRSLTAIVTCALLSIVLFQVPARIHGSIDRRFFDSIWINPTAEPRTEVIPNPILKSEASASSVAPRTSLDGPLNLKPEHLLVGKINFWGEEFDLDPFAHWMPEDSVAGKVWFEQRFDGTSQVSDIALRFWGLPKKRGIHTPAAFEIQALGPENEPPTRVAEFPAGTGRVTLLGKYLCVHYKFSPPVEADGLRIVFGDTVSGGPPLMSDFLAFGARADSESMPEP